ncbi:hypothetical protein BS17DRAFT_786795 [Gyrodon lividus]|nr:hypothetical protein BS17DRAFT_786795 [Gyrodon lividus]
MVRSLRLFGTQVSLKRQGSLKGYAYKPASTQLNPSPKLTSSHIIPASYHATHSSPRHLLVLGRSFRSQNSHS